MIDNNNLTTTDHKNKLFNDAQIELEMQNQEMHRAYEAIKESEERFRLMFMNAPIPYQSLDEKGNFLDVNKAYLAATGYTREELIGRNFGDILHPDWINHFKENFPKFKSIGETLGVEFEIVKKDGLIILVSFSGNIQRDINGSFQRTHCVFQDITEKRKAEIEKAESEAINLHLKKTESLGRMAGAIAHHYNNMLAVIIGNLELAMDHINSGTVKPIEELLEAVNAARRASSMGTQILSYLGQRQTMFGQQIFDIAETCCHWLSEFRVNIPQHIAFETSLPTSELLINANPDQIKQVLNSIIINAVEAVEDSAGVICFNIKSCQSTEIAKTHRFPVEWKPDSETYACLEVRDKGCGIPAIEMEKIFDPFYSTRFIGRGLGLSVALGIIKAHGGCITVKSTPVRGTVFRIFLPLSKKQAPHKDLAAANKFENNFTFEGLTILVVEDEPMVRKMLIHMLKRLGIKAVEAKDGVEAVEVFCSRKDEFFCVISDLSMPKMDGWETIEALRKIKQDVKVILASGYDQSHVMQGSHSELPQIFLNKPYSLTTLRSALEQIC